MVVLNQLPVLFPNGSVESQIDRLLDDAVRSVSEWSRAWDPSCNVYEDEAGFTIQMALPGLDPQQIDVQIEDQMLRVKGERRVDTSQERTWYSRDIAEGPFSCSFKLPAYVNQEKSTASYKQGLLTITFPKRDEAKPRRIAIECH